MQTLAMSLCLLVTLAISCAKPTEEKVTAVENGDFKILVRSQEFHHSSIRNVDICVAETTSREFPKDKGQCFLHGFDFSGLTVKWRSERIVEIAFDCGRVTTFSNSAILTGVELPVEFGARLTESCSHVP